MNAPTVPAPDASSPLASAADFRSAMQRLAGTVCLVTTEHEGLRLGLTATAVCSLSADPPSLLVCVNTRATAHDSIVASRRIGVNVLSAEQVALSVSFSSTEGPRGPARFETGAWTTQLTGAPILADAAAWFDCRVVERVQASTHSIFICHVAAAGTPGGNVPLIYANRQYGRTTPHAD